MPYGKPYGDEKRTPVRGKPGFTGAGPRRDKRMEEWEMKGFPELQKKKAKAIRKKKEVDYGGFGDYD